MASKFLDSPGITHLWEQIKALIGGKVDKVSSSTDNAVVRFNGTSGDIQNSGVTINDSNHLTAAKLITSGGTSSQFVMGDGSLKDRYFQTLNTFTTDGKVLYIEPLMDGMYAANNRWTVAATVTDSSGDTPVETNVSSSQVNGWFGGDFSRVGYTFGNNKTVKITISHSDPENNYQWLYPNGYIIVAFYNYGLPKTITGRLYAGSGSAKGWYTMNFSSTRGGRNGIYIAAIPYEAYGRTIEITVEGQSVKGDPSYTALSYIAWCRTRAAIGDYPVVTKYATAQRMYGNLTAPKFITSGGTSSQFVKGDGSLDSNTYVKTSDLKVTTNTNIGIDAPGTNAIGYVSGLTRADWNYQQVDGSLYTQFYNSNWINEIFQDFRTGQLSIRSRNNGTWLPWRRVLDETNATTILGLNTYAPLASPALTGTPTAPTAAAGTNTTQIATTEFVQNTLSNNLASYNITLNGTFPEGWYRVAKLGSCFSGIVYLVGTYTSARPTVATFAISGKATNVGCDIIQLSGTAVSGGVSKIRLVSGEDGDSTFYLDMYKATSVNISTTYFTFSGMYYDLENAVSTTVLNTASTYVRKVCDIKTITEDMYVTTSTFNEEIGTLNDEIATLTDGTAASESGNVIDIGEYDLMKIREIKGNSQVYEDTVVGNNVEKLDVTGFNIWDEEWEVGLINIYNGGNQSSQNNIRSKNYNLIYPNCNYFGYRAGLTNRYSLYIVFYDSNKNFISYASICNIEFTPPSNAKYYRLFTSQTDYGTTYNHDICINKSDTSKNGTYEPYKHSEFPLNLTELTGKVNGEGTSVTIFPDGLHGAGTAYDSLIVDDDGYARRAIKRISSVDLGSLSWTHRTDIDNSLFNTTISSRQSGRSTTCMSSKYTYGGGVWGAAEVAAKGDKKITYYLGTGTYAGMTYVYDSSYSSYTAADFKTAVSGVMLYYELATPIEYVLDTPVQCVVPISKNGTVKQVPVMPDSTPMVMDVTYLHDTGGVIGGLIGNYATKDYVDTSIGNIETLLASI